MDAHIKEISIISYAADYSLCLGKVKSSGVPLDSYNASEFFILHAFHQLCSEALQQEDKNTPWIRCKDESFILLS